MSKSTGNDRLYYWGTITVLVLMMLYTYSEYKDLGKLVEDSQRISNRQLQLIGESNRKTVDRLTEALDSK
jgi:hypothetical protein